MPIISLVMVEDDPMLIEIYKDFIQQIGGFSIAESARTGQQALQVIKSFQPTLVVLDINLPDMNGVDLLKELRRLEMPLDVIIITASQDVATIQNVLRLGVLDYIIKPFKFPRIKATLEKYKVFVKKVNSQVNMDQEELDGLMNRVFLRDKSKIPKGLREITLNRILNFLATSKQGRSAEEVANGVGLARVTARRYLDYLANTGQVVLESQYGSVGRPVNRYKGV